jgi:hypothetical protein
MMNTGTTGSPFSNVTTYTSGSRSHTLTTADDGLVDGKIYTFKWYAVNDYGTGEDSDEIQVGVTDVFAASASMTKVSSLSTKTSISVTWGAVTAGTTPAGDILGYILYVKDCENGTSWIAFNGTELGMYYTYLDLFINRQICGSKRQ